MCSYPDSHKIVLEALIHALNISMADLLSLLTYQAPISNLLLVSPIEPETSPAWTAPTHPPPRPPRHRPSSPWYHVRAIFTSLTIITYILTVVCTYIYVYTKSEQGRKMDNPVSINPDEESIYEHVGSISDDEDMELLWDDDDAIQGDNEDLIQDHEGESIQDHERWQRGRQRVRQSDANQESEEEVDPILAWRANVL
ncbi:hypothetical protein A1F94_010877 [Pyrenophora tritici-repentis]|uniref:Uncharacterized protein n=2 Tax=Pyrenophora tritici-repentis TaxID=45151 RepID=B2WAZ1_PYRTR|nr:uncharacterized protein PTRG_07454 [Pyrenophora tritici-repentis Pt-1C-BFP]KAA8615046.1 hypothetical protein PtrV1_12076 [Pyrenophora tritici-repentis]EDU50373.1 predicted protein [Pyrenophora tritici-repentis Pt-1C-BFP]KAG9379108.1 hypothetical protein A1F94_010877 [Pyrenophora tritici-repentis]KAI1537328.1 hypothetical protein PtrSN001C_006170 [Pyrenophora tritici-repentis]KAI1596339.1 hypothetical protein PtrCC142_009744 [Pyrenophora tritici-repentis]